MMMTLFAAFSGEAYRIVEFYNSHHPDPNNPKEASQMDEQFQNGMFRFEKRIG